MKIHFASSTFVWLLCCSAQADIINVPTDQPTIQAAIVAANPGDEVIVAQGEYFESIDFLGKAITVRSTDPNDAGVVLNTIINGTGFFHVVQCITGEGPDTVLSGFIITGGNANGTGFDGLGSGMFNSSSSPTVTNCSFTANSAPGSGGGMYNAGSSPTVTNCSFSGNTAADGGGMFNSASCTKVVNCSFSHNTATNGGGMFNTSVNPGVNPTVTNTGFCNNTPDQIIGPFIDCGGNSLLYCPPPITVPTSCPGDISGDGNVNVTELLMLLAAWGPHVCSNPADFNGDGEVNVTDLLSLLAAWGACP